MCVVCGCAVDTRPYARPNEQQMAPSADIGLQGAVAVPRGGDGRVEQADVPRQQPPWGWGLAPALAREDVASALTDLVMNPAGFTVRQQDAVRRDVAEQLGDYLNYQPVPFVGQEVVHGSWGRKGENSGE